MPADDQKAVGSPRFLHNQRQNMACAKASPQEIYGRGLSQYGEKAVEPLIMVGWSKDWTA